LKTEKIIWAPLQAAINGAATHRCRITLLFILLNLLSCATIPSNNLEGAAQPLNEPTPINNPVELPSMAPEPVLTNDELTLYLFEQFTAEQQQLTKALLLTINPKNLNDDWLPHYHRLVFSLFITQLNYHEVGLTSPAITTLAYDNNSLWLGDEAGSIVKYNLQNNHILTLRQSGGQINSFYINENEVWAIAVDGLLRYHKESEAISFFPLANSRQLVSYNGQLVLLREGNLFTLNGHNFVASDTPSLAKVSEIFIFFNDLVAIAESDVWFYYEDKWQPASFFSSAALFEHANLNLDQPTEELVTKINNFLPKNDPFLTNFEGLKLLATSPHHLFLVSYGAVIIVDKAFLQTL